ncbi:MAG: hypothetical protein ACO3GM_04190 [Candidatus Limnocylindrus sp.]
MTTTTTTTTAQTTIQGARCLAPKSAKSHGGYNYCGVGLYEAQPRKDGVLTWRLVDTVCEVTTAKKQERELAAHAEAMGLPVVRNARQHVVCP